MKSVLNQVLIWTFLFLSTGLCFGQSWYLKTGASYNIPITKQPMPNYFSLNAPLPSWSGGSSAYVINFKNSDFSIAQGLNLQGAVGYTINDLLSFELGASFFSNAKQEFGAYPVYQYTFNGKTNWNYKNYSVLPSLLIGHKFNRSTVNIKLITGIGVSDLNIEASLLNYFNKYSFKRSVSYSYGYGIEYAYRLSSFLQFYADAGINNTFYTPTHAEIVSSSASPVTTYEKQIDYVQEITNLRPTPNKPEIRSRETLKLNSVYLGVGFKYILYTK